MEKRIYTHPYFGDICYSVKIDERVKDLEKRPLLIFLHGAGERGRSHEVLHRGGLTPHIESGKASLPCVWVCPQCPENVTWVNLAHMLVEFIEFIIEEYRIDREKISLTGLSMGGYGTWEMAMFAPQYFKKIAPICGGGTPWRTELIKAQIRAFHGDCDETVPQENSYMMVDAARRNGKDARLTVFHGVGHNSWDEAYFNTDVLEWLIDLEK